MQIFSGQIANRQTANWQSFRAQAESGRRWSLFFALLLTALLCVWLSQQSINRYFQQTYHRPSPLMNLNRFALWRLGGQWQQAAEEWYAQMRQSIQTIDQRIAAQQPDLPTQQLALDEADLGAPLLAEDLLPENKGAEALSEVPSDKPEGLALEEGLGAAVADNPAVSGEEKAVDKPSVENKAVETAAARKPLLIGARDLSKAASSAQNAEQAVEKAPLAESGEKGAVENAAQDNVQAVDKAEKSALSAENGKAEAVEKAPFAESGEKRAVENTAQDSVQAVDKAEKSALSAENGKAEAVEKAPLVESGEKGAVENTAQNNVQAVNKTENLAFGAENGKAEAVEKVPFAESGEKIAVENAAQNGVQAVNKAEKSALSAENGKAEAVEKASLAESGEKGAVENAAQDNIQAVNKAENSALSAENGKAEAVEKAPLAESGEKGAVENAAQAPSKNPNIHATKYLEIIPLTPSDTVLLIGDSLMQGVAPFVQQTLQQRYNIKSVNLSKQSTGLTYPDFFNWPLEVEKALAADSSIKAVVVFLGPNDPWDLPDPNKHEKAPYLKFKSKEWEAVYRSRISRIVQAAAAHDAGVIWLGIPFMKAEPLNSQMQYLDGVMRSEVRDKAIFVPTKYILTGGAEGYTDSMVLDGKAVRLRSKDGIHFTPAGQKQIAIAVMRRLQLAQP